MAEFRDREFEFDMAVIGAGSAGLSAAKSAAQLGRRVLLCNWVPPGRGWGVGGTSLHVGCVPKKLMHKAALLGLDMKQAPSFGWRAAPQVQFSWREMTSNIQAYVTRRSDEIAASLSQLGVRYERVFAHVSAPHTITMHSGPGSADGQVVTARHIVVATGSSPRVPDIPGARDLAITSNHFFSLQQSPGKCLVVGAGYVGVELAGVLASLGLHCTLLARNLVLGGMDREMADLVERQLTRLGVTFLRGCEMTSVHRVSPPSPQHPAVLAVKLVSSEGTREEMFSTVLLAVGRDANTSGFGLPEIGVKLHEATRQILVDEFEATSVADVFAVGDVAFARPKLSPVAVKSAQLLVQRLYAGSEVLADYSLVPSAVFTPLEYAYVGLTQHEARAKFGAEHVQVRTTHFTPLELQLPPRHLDTDVCCCKVIWVTSLQDRVVGVHILCPSAGDIVQGFAVALKIGATKSHLAALMAVHPTCAEWITRLM